MLEMAILGLLQEQPMHGYDLRKRLRSDVGLLSSLSFGSLYPALARLEADGAVREVGVSSGSRFPAWARAEQAVPLSGSLTGERAAFRARLAARTGAARVSTGRPGSGTRARKVYEITDHGRDLFDRLLAEEPRQEDAKEFALRWAFARHLTSEARLRLLDRRRRELADRLSAARRSVEVPPRPLDRFQRSLAEHAVAIAQLDLEWIDQLIAAEPADRPDQPATTVPVIGSVTRSMT